MVKQGEIVWLDFDPQTGHEQRGRRPALVISNNVFNRFSSLAMVCPITHTNKSYPFQTPLGGEYQTSGVILCDQVRMLDVNARNAVHIETVADDILDEVIDIISGFMEKS